MATHSWGGAVNTTAMSTSNLPYISTPGIGAPVGNLAANGARPIRIYAPSLAYVVNGSAALNYAGNPGFTDETFPNSGGTFTIVAVRSGGTMNVGRNSAAGGATYWSDGDSLPGQMPGSFLWATVPAAPATPGVSSAGAASLTVTWVAPSNGDSAITGYRIEVATDASFTLNKAVAEVGVTTTATLTGLLPGQLYYVRVAAMNAVSTAVGTYGGWSGTATVLVLSGAKVGVGGVWKDAAVYYGVNGEWKPCAVFVGSGAAWKPLTP